MSVVFSRFRNQESNVGWKAKRERLVGGAWQDWRRRTKDMRKNEKEEKDWNEKWWMKDRKGEWWIEKMGENCERGNEKKIITAQYVFIWEWLTLSCLPHAVCRHLFQFLILLYFSFISYLLAQVRSIRVFNESTNRHLSRPCADMVGIHVAQHASHGWEDGEDCGWLNNPKQIHKITSQNYDTISKTLQRLAYPAAHFPVFQTYPSRSKGLSIFHLTIST